MLTAVQTGLRLSEMTGLTHEDYVLAAGAHLRVTGKGRKERCVPLAKSTRTVLKAWLRTPQRGDNGVLFPSARGKRLSVHAWRAVSAEQAPHDRLQSVSFPKTEACHCPLFEAYHGPVASGC